MLEEIIADQKEKNIFRRWFKDDYFELIVWYNAGAYSIRGFQLCYDIRREERSLTWSVGKGFSHHGVDDGSQPMRHPSSPTLVEDGLFPGQAVMDRFIASCARIDRAVARLVITKINEYGSLGMDLDAVFEELDRKPVSADTPVRPGALSRGEGLSGPEGKNPDRKTGPGLIVARDLLSGAMRGMLSFFRGPRPGPGKLPAGSETIDLHMKPEDLDAVMKKSRLLAKKLSKKR